MNSSTNRIKALLIAVLTNMADVFSLEEIDECGDDDNESDSSTSEANIIIEEVLETENLLNNSSDNSNESVISDMTLNQSSPESEPSPSDDMIVNIDDLLPPVDKLEKYANSEIVFNRQAVARNVLETLRLVHEDDDAVSRVVNVLCIISEDYDSNVRAELMVQLPHIIAFCKDVKQNSTIVQNLVPMLINYLGDENQQVRKTSHSALLSIIEDGLLDYGTISDKVCPLILHLTESVQQEDLRTECINLMSKLVVLMGRKAAEELFFSRLFVLCVDSNNNIRKACASTFGDLCTTCGQQATEAVLLPKFLVLCEDNAWCVRKACAENFTSVSRIVSRETRWRELSFLYMVLLSDQSRWVRITAYQALGPFISTFAEPERTGLHYSKNGDIIFDLPTQVVEAKLPVIDTANSIMCNGDIDEQTDRTSNGDEAIRTDSSTACDTLVPQCTTDSNLSASEVQRASHSNRKCPVIDTTPSDKIDGSSFDERNAHCDPLSEDSPCNNERTKNARDWQATLDESLKEFTNLWHETVNGMDTKWLVNGYLNGGEEVRQTESQLELLSELASDDHDDQGFKSATDAALLSSKHHNKILPVVNGDISQHSNDIVSSLCISQLASYEKDSSEPQGETLPLNGDHSADVVSSCSNSCDNTSNYQSKSSQQSPSTALLSMETSSNKSAFNQFQYWREPLPDIDFEAAMEDLNRSSLFNSSNEHCQGFPNFSSDLRLCSPWREKQKKCSLKYFPRKFAFSQSCGSLQMGEKRLPEGKLDGSKKLSVYDQDIVPPELLLQYLNMVDVVWAQTIDAEISRHCAYSFPAVALTLGRQFWPCLRDTFEALSSDIQGFIMTWKVRRTLASALHQLAVILGPDITSNDLLPVFARFINDLDEVRIGMLQHIYEFFKVLKPDERKKYLPSLSEFLVSKTYADWNEKNWRFRLIFAEQLVAVVDLYEPSEVKAHIVPLSLTLLKDKVCEVRLAAVRVVASIMRLFGQCQTGVFRKYFISQLSENFLHSAKWLYRQLYVYISQECLVECALTPEQFADDFFPELIYLCWDRVPNVRIAIARCLVVAIWSLEEFSSSESQHRQLLLQTIHTLQTDVDSDVRFFANMVTAHECSCLLHNGVAEPFV